jgi:hypothetical protein
VLASHMSGAGQECPGYVADIGAVLIQPDALDQFPALFLGQARIRADGADFRAIEARLDAFDRGVTVVAGGRRVGAEHGFQTTHERFSCDRDAYPRMQD